MDLYLLSHLIQRGRYSVPGDLVAEAMLRWIEPDLTLEVSPGPSHTPWDAVPLEEMAAVGARAARQALHPHR